MNKKRFCDNCQKKEIRVGDEGVNLKKNYQGADSNKLKVVCYECYDKKEQYYLENYDFIYSYKKEHYEKNGTGYIKTGSARCYANKKGSDGEVLRQDFCSHCSPWRFKDKDKPNKEKNPKNKNSEEINKESSWEWIKPVSIIGGIFLLVGVIIWLFKRKGNNE